MIENKMSRSDLYNLVWSKPASKIIKDYSITITVFKSFCRDHNVPLPKNGYWSKLKHNVPVERATFPNQNDDYVVTLNDSSFSKFISPQGKTHNLKKELLKNPSLNFTVADHLNKPDPLIVSAKQGMKDFQKRGFYSRGEVISTLEGQISISVAKNNISSALLFMDALVKLLKKRGHKIDVEGSTKIIINQQEIKVRFREIMKREQHPEHSWITKMPSGILSFRIDSHNSKEWRDSESRPLNSMLVDILIKLEAVSKEMEEYQVQLEKGWEEQRKRRDEEKRIIEKREKEKKDFKSLINSSGRWYKSQNLRSYLNEFENKSIQSNTLSNEKMEWLQWARKKADWYDPFIESEDEVFRDIDRDSF